MNTIFNNYIKIWYGSAKNDDDFIKCVLFEVLLISLSILLAMIAYKLNMNYRVFAFPIIVCIGMVAFVFYLRYSK